MSEALSLLKLTLGRRFYQLSGRASRREFWLCAMFFVLVNGLSLLMLPFIPVVGSLLSAVLFLVLLCPLLCTITRRLHDLNLNGLMAPVPVVLGIAAVMLADLADRSGDPHLQEAALYGAAGFGVLVAAFVWLLSKKGHEGPNQYGADPQDTQALESEEQQRAQQAHEALQQVAKAPKGKPSFAPFQTPASVIKAQARQSQPGMQNAAVQNSEPEQGKDGK